MPKVMEIIEKETKGKSYHTYKYSYDDVNIVSSMEMDIKYEYAKDGKNYKVEETLVRRQDPYRDLGFEEWK